MLYKLFKGSVSNFEYWFSDKKQLEKLKSIDKILKSILKDGDTLAKRIYFNKYNELVMSQSSSENEDAARIIQEFVEKKLKSKNFTYWNGKEWKRMKRDILKFKTNVGDVFDLTL